MAGASAAAFKGSTSPWTAHATWIAAPARFLAFNVGGRNMTLCKTRTSVAPCNRMLVLLVPLRTGRRSPANGPPRMREPILRLPFLALYPRAKISLIASL